jgi:lipoprotein NlpI
MKVSWIVCLVPLLAAPAFAQVDVNDAMKKCFDLSGDPAIQACTSAIDSGQLNNSNLSIMYYNRGCEWRDKGEYNLAITDFDQALRLDPNYTSAYNNRGLARREKGDYDGSIADFDQAIRLDPNHVNAYYGRGRDYYSKGQYDKAIADLDQAVQLNPKLSGAIFNRGIVYSSSRNWAAAAADFSSANQLDSSDAYAVLWLALVGMHQPDSGWAARLEEQSKGLSQNWPIPLVHFYAGQLAADQVLAAAIDADAVKQQKQLCEAAFYLGEWKLAHGQKHDAAQDLEKAQSTCPIKFPEYTAAVQELRNLPSQ